MKHLTTFLTLSLFLSLCFSQTVHSSVLYKEAPDTLILKSTRVRGNGLFYLGAGSALIGDTVEFRSRISYEDFPMTIPAGFSNIEIGIQPIYITPLRFFSENEKDLNQEPMSNRENLFALMSATKDNKVY